MWRRLRTFRLVTASVLAIVIVVSIALLAFALNNVSPAME